MALEERDLTRGIEQIARHETIVEIEQMHAEQVVLHQPIEQPRLVRSREMIIAKRVSERVETRAANLPDEGIVAAKPQKVMIAQSGGRPSRRPRHARIESAVTRGEIGKDGIVGAKPGAGAVGQAGRSDRARGHGFGLPSIEEFGPHRPDPEPARRHLVEPPE
jgi:hypothetical protein